MCWIGNNGLGVDPFTPGPGFIKKWHLTVPPEEAYQGVEGVVFIKGKALALIIMEQDRALACVQDNHKHLNVQVIRFFLVPA